jgi:hypothetical protein
MYHNEVAKSQTNKVLDITKRLKTFNSFSSVA